MRIFFRKNMLLLFWIGASADILALLFNINLLHFALKPLLLPVLISAVLLNPKPAGARRIVVTALLFSFAGDVFLLFADKNSAFFIAGLICFLLTLILYCWYFLQIPNTGISLLKQRPYLFIPVTVYTVCLLSLLVPGLGALKMPVITYATVLSIMLLCCLHAYNFLHEHARIYLVTGATCFVISDSLLAIDKFYASFNYAGAAIMFTYCWAQYLLVKGFIKNGV